MRKNAQINQKDLIQLDNVSKWFETPAGRFDALKGISLKITKGEYVAIVGRSGSGKSTLLNMLSGIDHPAEGSITIGPAELGSMNESQLARFRGETIGIVFQFFQLIPTLTVKENLLIAMDFVGKIPVKRRLERAELLLSRVGISGHADKFPAALSGGEQQRAAIARALVNDPPILIADEPTGNLDERTSQGIRDLFAELCREGKTVILVTHETVHDVRYDRLITLADGQIQNDMPMHHASDARKGA